LSRIPEGTSVCNIENRFGDGGKLGVDVARGRRGSEDLRELDKKLRDTYYEDFKGMRHKWEEIYLEALNANQRNGADYKKIIQVMDRVGEKINRADYGYAGLMDRKGDIRENALAKVFDYDKEFSAYLDRLKESEENVDNANENL
jgi:hypothetical protein